MLALNNIWVFKFLEIARVFSTLEQKQEAGARTSPHPVYYK